jgi:hypothetical protein
VRLTQSVRHGRPVSAERAAASRTASINASKSDRCVDPVNFDNLHNYGVAPTLSWTGGIHEVKMGVTLAGTDGRHEILNAV